MTPLAEALRDCKVTQKSLAEKLRVSVTAVNSWATGRSPLPAGRMTEVSEFLKVPTAVLAEMTSGAPNVGTRVTAHPPSTFLDWVLQDDSLSLDLGSTYRDRILALSDFLGVSLGQALAWVQQGNIPVSVVKKFAARYWPGMNPVIFAGDAVDVLDEAEDVSLTLADMSTGLAYETYSEALTRLSAARDAYRMNPYTTADVEWMLDDGRRVPEGFRAVVERVGRL